MDKILNKTAEKVDKTEKTGYYSRRWLAEMYHLNTLYFLIDPFRAAAGADLLLF